MLSFTHPLYYSGLKNALQYCDCTQAYFQRLKRSFSPPPTLTLVHFSSNQSALMSLNLTDTVSIMLCCTKTLPWPLQKPAAMPQLIHGSGENRANLNSELESMSQSSVLFFNGIIIWLTAFFYVTHVKYQTVPWPIRTLYKPPSMVMYECY